MTTKDKVKEYLQITVTTHDTVLDSIVASVNAFVETYLNRALEEDERVEYFDGYEKSLILTTYPVSTAKVEVNRGTNSSENWQEVSADDYSLDKEVGAIMLSYSQGAGSRKIRVTYTGGYTEVPFDLELVATQLSARAFDQRKGQGRTKETFSSSSIDWSNTITEEQKGVLNKYKNITL